MSEGYQPLTVEALKTTEGVADLNRMLDTLFNRGSRQSIQYGDNSTLTASDYQHGLDRVIFTASIGYPMHKSGSIIGHACNLTVDVATSGSVTMEVRINDSVQSDLSLTYPATEGTGVKNKTTTAPRFAVPFSKGDVITAHSTLSGTMTWDDMLGNIEVQFDD